VTGRPDGRPEGRSDDEQEPNGIAGGWPVVAGWDHGRPSWPWSRGRYVSADRDASTVSLGGRSLTPTQARRLAEALLRAVGYLDDA
jgi:hypothetical protein